MYIVLCAFLSYIFDEPYLTTLTTKIVILSIAGMGLNFVLGYGEWFHLDMPPFLVLGDMLQEFLLFMHKI